MNREPFLKFQNRQNLSFYLTGKRFESWKVTVKILFSVWNRIFSNKVFEVTETQFIFLILTIKPRCWGNLNTQFASGPTQNYILKHLYDKIWTFSIFKFRKCGLDSEDSILKWLKTYNIPGTKLLTKIFIVGIKLMIQKTLIRI